MSVSGEQSLLRRLGNLERDYREAPWLNAWRGSLLAKAGAILSALPEPPARVLDAGCGSGYLSAFLVLSGYAVAGLDVCEDGLNLVRQRADYTGWPLWSHDWVQPFPAAPYDAIIFNDAFHHAMDKRRVMTNTFAALAPDGLAVFVEPGVTHGWFSRSHARQYDVTETSTPPLQIVRLAKRAGFRAWRVRPHPETLAKALYGPAGMLSHHRLAHWLSQFGAGLALVLLAGKWLHGMAVVSKSGRWPRAVNPMAKLQARQP